MINEKIKELRKKKQLSQDALAEKLDVSRQTITKWETGATIPTLDYLIKMSSLFGVTIDNIVKDDDCLKGDTNINNCDEFVSFLVEAKKNTYAAKTNKVEPSRKQSHDFVFEKDGYKYIDSFFGSSSFSGQELVYNNDIPIWSMNYYGVVLDDSFSGDFLKEALLQVNNQNPYRGLECYGYGDYQYHCSNNGSIEYFSGIEEIYYKGNKIYECLFHGGDLF